MQKVYIAWAHVKRVIAERKSSHTISLFFALYMTFFVSVSVVSIYAWGGRTHAAANDTMNFQARILNNTGGLVADGFYTVEFKLYAVETGGTEVWTESQVLTVKNGYLTADLGAVTAFGGGIDWSQELWLSMNINTDGEMDPRMKVTAVPLAFRANQADTLTTATGTIAADGLVQLAPSSVQASVASTSAVRINQTGTGGLLQLQGDGADVLTLTKGGDLTIARGMTIGASTLTTAGTIRWTGLDFEGYDGAQWVSLTSGSGGGGTVNQKTIVKTVNETVNSNITLQNDDELLFSIGANETWAFRFVVQGISATQPDFQFAVTAPSGATCTVGVVDGEGSVAVGNLGCGVSSGSIAGNGTDDVYEIMGTVANGSTAGNVTLQWAQNTSNAANTTVYAGSYVLATGTTTGGGLEFIQGGNAFGSTAVLGTTDNNSLSLITNGLSRLTIDNAGAVDVAQGLTVGNSLTVSTGGLAVTGNSTITGTLTGLTGLTVSSGGATINGGIDVNNGGITNAGSITGIGTSLSATAGLTITSGGSNSIVLDAGNNILVLGDATLQRTASGTTALELNDTSNTAFSIVNTDGTAVAGLSVEGGITASSYSGNGSLLTSLNANNISSGSISDSLLSSNVGLLDTSKTYSALQTFNSGLTVGNTAVSNAGTIRWTGLDFEGYDGTQWVSLTGGGGGGGGGSSGVVTVIKPSDQNISNTATLTNDADLAFAVEASEEWTFRFVVQANSAVTPDLQFAVTAPTGATCDINIIDAEGATTVSNVGCGVTSGMVTGNGTDDTYEIVGTIINSTTAGTVRLQWAQNTSDAATTTVYAGSFLTAIPVVGGSATPVNAFVQNGNSFGGTALLGTADGQDLQLITNGLTRLTITNSGDTTVSGVLEATAAALFDANVTIGNEASDILTLNSDSIVLNNGLDIDSGTFVIDSASNMIGINTASPDNILSINSPSTTDLSADVLIATSGINQKGLVIQATSGQVENMLEVQDVNGVARLAVSGTGSLVLGSDEAGASSAGSLILHDSVNANGFTSVLGTNSLTGNRSIVLPDASGTICISGSATCGFIALGPSSALVDSSSNNSLYINKTGASGDILTLQKNGTSILRMLNSGALQIQLTDTSAFSVKNAGGTDFFSIDTSGGLVRVGSATPDATGTLLVLDTKNTAGDPTGTNGSIYYNSNLAKFRCFQDSAWIDCIGTRQIRSFIDTTSDAAADNDTTNYWDISGENNNSYANITPSSTVKSVTGSVIMEVSSGTTQDRSIVAHVERGIGSAPTCGSGTVVGSRLSTFTTNTGELATSTIIFVDSPATTSSVYYTLCADSATSAAGGMTINTIRITLEEANNSN